MRALRGLYRGLEAVNGADSGIDPVAFLVPFTPRGAGDDRPGGDAAGRLGVPRRRVPRADRAGSRADLPPLTAR